MTGDGAPALPRTCCATVWLHPGHALYAGPSLQLTPHSGSVWCLAVGVDAPLTVTTAEGPLTARSVLVPPRLTHHLDTHGGRLVSCYLDPSSGRSAAATRMFAERAGELTARHAAEDTLTTMPDDDCAATRWLDRAAPATARPVDSRIAYAARLIREQPAAATSSRELAAAAGLSESRFLHLFREQMGTSVRRYRLWVRLMAAATALAAGRNLTVAAADAGFASPSHLADRFRSTFGLSASQLLDTGLALRISPPDRLTSSG